MLPRDKIKAPPTESLKDSLASITSIDSHDIPLNDRIRMGALQKYKKYSKYFNLIVDRFISMEDAYPFNYSIP